MDIERARPDLWTDYDMMLSFLLTIVNIVGIDLIYEGIAVGFLYIVGKPPSSGCPYWVTTNQILSPSN